MHGMRIPIPNMHLHAVSASYFAKTRPDENPKTIPIFYEVMES